jgi:hypothetical protein
MSSSGSKPVRHNYPNDEVFEAAMMEYLQATKQVSRPRLLFTQEEIENKNLLFEEWGFSQSFEEPRLPKAVVAAKAEEQPVVTVEEAKKNPLEAMRRLIGLGPDAEKGQRGIEKRRQQMLEMKRRRQQHELEASYHYIPPD